MERNSLTLTRSLRDLHGTRVQYVDDHRWFCGFELASGATCQIHSICLIQSFYHTFILSHHFNHSHNALTPEGQTTTQCYPKLVDFLPRCLHHNVSMTAAKTLRNWALASTPKVCRKPINHQSLINPSEHFSNQFERHF